MDDQTQAVWGDKAGRVLVRDDQTTEQQAEWGEQTARGTVGVD